MPSEITRAAAEQAEAFVKQMQIVPTSDGGVQLEWHYTGVDLEVYIEPDGEISAWCREREEVM